MIPFLILKSRNYTVISAGTICYTYTLVNCIDINTKQNVVIGGTVTTTDIATIGLIVALIVLFFGNNLVQQLTGSSVFEWIGRFFKGIGNLVSLIIRPLNKWRSRRLALPSDSETPVVISFARSLGAIDVFQPPLTRNLIEAKSYAKARLKADIKIEAAFDFLNQKRRAVGKFEHYPHLRYRIIKRPQLQEKHSKQFYVIDLGEIDFQYLALLQEPGVDLATKEYIKQKIETSAKSLPSSFQSLDSRLNSRNAGLLGVQMVLITSDDYILLRRRGIHVLEWSQAWDVSVSGYSGNRVFENGKFDIGNTVEYELDEEIRKLRGDPREIFFTGLHLSERSGTTVMLGYWKVQATSDELRSYIHKKTNDTPLVFDTNILPKEKFVWDYKNMIVEFDGPTIAKALPRAEKTLSKKPYSFVDASMASLVLALAANGKSTEGLLN
ncbi:MAG: hypothetical protein IAF58_08670 [Leptolyngbya sp.]|nr:hypothetical protein [Candidatus Melainabacteria bacterium]